MYKRKSKKKKKYFYSMIFVRVYYVDRTGMYHIIIRVRSYEFVYIRCV